MFYKLTDGRRSRIREVRQVADGYVYSFNGNRCGPGSEQWPFTDTLNDFLRDAWHYQWFCFWKLTGEFYPAPPRTRNKWLTTIATGNYLSVEFGKTLKERQKEFESTTRSAICRRRGPSSSTPARRA